jgi:hypothetical protein
VNEVGSEVCCTLARYEDKTEHEIRRREKMTKQMFFNQTSSTPHEVGIRRSDDALNFLKWQQFLVSSVDVSCKETESHQ